MKGTGPDRTAPDDVDDAAVIEGSVRDPERFAVIFDRHAPHIQRYLARRLGQEIADDLVSETFLIAFRKRSRYDLGRRDARPWLYGIASNLIGQHQRDEAREYRLWQAMAREEHEASHAERASTEATTQAVRQRLANALAQLSPGDRDVLLLIAWEELSYDEVASALAIPVGTVRSRLHRARGKVRLALADANPTTTFEEICQNG
jgi:RNA polymerase sigma factor (sigma-70 family)